MTTSAPTVLRTGRFVPVTAAAIALAGDPTADGWQDDVASHLTRIGARTHVDLGHMLPVDPDRAVAIARYWRAALRAVHAAPGRPACPPGSPSLEVAEELLDVAQRASGDNRHDLAAEHAALVDTPGLGHLATAMLDSDPDLDRVATLAAVLGGTVTADQPGLIRADVHVDMRVGWPLALGGDLSPFETGRQVSIVARHAAWRRWAVRRLGHVTVVSRQRWPAAPTTVP